LPTGASLLFHNLNLKNMYIFTFKKRASKLSSIFTFIGTWAQFESKYPGAIIISPLEPVEL